jgi:mannonate dehydratase
MMQTWRWFGPEDTISMDALLQSSVEGVVTALHHVDTGAVWTIDEIKMRQQQITALENGTPSGLKWEVVESLPISESIKTRTGDFEEHIANYKQSLHNLAECGLKTICYNFMPILDWTRTDLRSPMAHGGTAMRFDLMEFTAFDMFILSRENAADDYPEHIRTAAEGYFRTLSEKQKSVLQHNIVAGLPGSNDKWDVADIKDLLNTYTDINATQLRANLITFLEAVIPTCKELEINLCCHPDDPPFSIMGLPRIMSTMEDYEFVMRAVDSPHNGITLCTGSLGVSPSINIVKMIENLGSRIHFVHLRNTKRDGPNFNEKHSFFEAEHLEGDTDMVAVIAALLNEEKHRRKQGRADWNIPMRPDHGQEILDDLDKNSMPGYPLIGRMRGLAELRGVIKAIQHKPNN